MIDSLYAANRSRFQTVTTYNEENKVTGNDGAGKARMIDLRSGSLKDDLQQEEGSVLSRESINILDRYSVHSSQISDGNDYQNYKNEKYRLMSVDGD